MDEADRRVKAAARDASSADDLVDEGMFPAVTWEEQGLAHPLDEETLDEAASTQLGAYDSRRRGADE